MDRTKEPKPDFEERTLGYFRRYKVPLRILLAIGSDLENELRGAITAFGRYTITVVDLDHQREVILMKHAIVSIETSIDEERWRELQKPLDTKPPSSEG